MELVVIDASNRSAGTFRLRADGSESVSLLTANGLTVVTQWNKKNDPARFEKQTDGRSIRVGLKRFIIATETSDEELSRWLSIYSGEVVEVQSSSTSSDDGLESLRQSGQITAEEFERLQSERMKKERLQALRDSGILTDSELAILGVQPTAPPAPPPPVSRHQSSAARSQVVYRSSTNGFAIASFVLSLVGGSLLAVIFGHIALSQIRRTREGGRGLALAGLIIGYITIALIAIFVIAAMSAASNSGYYD